MKMINNYQDCLLLLTDTKASSAIKTYLENISKTKKGRVFEWYLAELFRGNGWLVKEQGGRDDMGADILLYHPKTPSDVSLIVQAKNQSAPLSFDETKIELNKFEEKAALKYRCNQYLIVSVNGFVRQAKELREFNMLLKDWSYVENLIFSYDPVNKAEPEIELYAHNEVTYHEVKRLWEKDRKVGVVQATGTGKSYIISKIMADFLAEEKLVMAPSKYILQQQESKVPWAMQLSTFMTYAKGATLTPEEISKLNCKLIVLDEFHRCGAEVWGSGVQKILNSFPDAYILGTSATPIRYLDNSRDMSDELFAGHVAENLSLSEAIVRRILPSPTYISALYTLDEEAGNLLIALENSQKTDTNKKELVEEIEKVRLDWEKTTGIPEILKKHLSHEINKIIIFCRDENHLDEMEAEVPKWFQKAKTHRWRKIYRVLNADPSRDANLEKFKKNNNKETIHLLFAINMLNEGLHIPDVGAVILLRPTESPIIFYQQIGRCIEVSTTNTPIIFDFVNNFKSIKANNFIQDLEKCNEIENARRMSHGLPTRSLYVRIIDETRDIVTIFESILSQIQPFAVGLDHLKEYAKTHGHPRAPYSYVTSSGFPLGRWVNSRRSNYSQGTLSADRVKALEAITGWVWDGVDIFFQEGIGHLQKYVQEYGNSRVPKSYKTSTGYPLGIWVCNKRVDYLKMILPDERVKALEEIAGWVWDPYEASFREALEHLKQFSHEHGHASVPRSYCTSSGFKLGPWANSRCVEYQKGILPNERVKALEALTGWTWNRKEAYFEEGLKNLEQYVNEHGHAKIPKNYLSPSGFKLGSWANSRYSQYKRGILPIDRMKKLEAITGWVLEPDQINFREALEHLEEFINEHGHARIPMKHKTSSGLYLSHWVARKCWEYSRGILSIEKIRALEKTYEFIWDSEEADFQEAIKHLEKYIHEHGHAKVPHTYKTSSGFRLGAWVTDRRAKYIKGVLPTERVKALEKITCWVWEPYSTAFLKGLENLKQYIHKYGDTKIPRGYKTPSGHTLGSWVHYMRYHHQKNSLSTEKVKALEALPGWFWYPKLPNLYGSLPKTKFQCAESLDSSA